MTSVNRHRFITQLEKRSSKPKPEEHDEVPTEVLAMTMAAAVTFFANHSSYGELIK